MNLGSMRWGQTANTKPKKEVRMKSKLRLLFLDIDGVLNTHNRFENGFCPIEWSNVCWLNNILREVPDLEIVLSSAWRYAFDNSHTIGHLLCCHGVNCFERVHGRTEWDPANDGTFPPYEDKEWWAQQGLIWRRDQIIEYVLKHKPDEFAIVDDLPLEVSCLFQTDPQVGLTSEIADAVIAHFTKGN